MKKLLIVFSLLLSTVNAIAATTNVTATLQDPAAQVLAGATVTALFRPVPGLSGPYTVNGVAFTQNPAAVVASNSGVMAITLTDNNTVIPVGSKWTFTICPKASVPACYQTSVTITGASQDISSSLNAAISTITVFGVPLPFAYNTGEVIVPANAGTAFWDTIANTVKFWNGSSWLAPLAAPFSLSSITDPYIDVRAMGALCDWNGTTGTDDLTAIQNSLNLTAAGGYGATILIPGRCKVSNDLSLAVNGTKLIGIGGSTLGGNQPNQSEIVSTKTGTGDILRANNSYGAYTIENLVIRANSCSYTGNIINLRSSGGGTNPTNITLDHVLVRGSESCGANTFSPDVGINLHGVIHTVIKNSEAQYVKRAINGCDTGGVGCSAAIEIHNFLCFTNHQCITNGGTGWVVDPLRVEGTGSDMQIYKDLTSANHVQNFFLHCTYCGDWVSTSAPLIQMYNPTMFTFTGDILPHQFNTSQLCMQFIGGGVIQDPSRVIIDGATLGCPIDLGSGDKGIWLSARGTTIASNAAGGPILNQATKPQQPINYQSSNYNVTAFGTNNHHGLDSSTITGNSTFGAMVWRSTIGQFFLAGTSRFGAVPVPDGSGVNWFGVGQGNISAACQGGVTGTNYTYFVWAKDRNGFRSYPAKQVGPISCAATLDATHYVKLFTVPDDGVVGYDVTKTDQVTKIGTGVFFDEDNIDCFGLGMCFYDKGASTSSYSPPTHAESADVTIDGWLNGQPVYTTPKASFSFTEEFMGPTLWHFFGSSSGGFVDGDTTHFGVIQLPSGGTNTNWTTIDPFNSAFTGGIMSGSVVWSFGWIAKPLGTTQQTILIGMRGDGSACSATDCPNGVYFKVTETTVAANWFAVCRSAGTSTTVDTGVLQDANYHSFEAKSNGAGSITFFIDGVLKATITTNIPSVDIQPATLIGTTATQNNLLNMDAYWLRASFTR